MIAARAQLFYTSHGSKAPECETHVHMSPTLRAGCYTLPPSTAGKFMHNHIVARPVELGRITLHTNKAVAGLSRQRTYAPQCLGS